MGCQDTESATFPLRPEAKRRRFNQDGRGKSGTNVKAWPRTNQIRESDLFALASTVLLARPSELYALLTAKAETPTMLAIIQASRKEPLALVATINLEIFAGRQADWISKAY